MLITEKLLEKIGNIQILNKVLNMRRPQTKMKSESWVRGVLVSNAGLSCLCAKLIIEIDLRSKLAQFCIRQAYLVDIHNVGPIRWNEAFGSYLVKL